jgi:hypothetical protein
MNRITPWGHWRLLVDNLEEKLIGQHYYIPKKSALFLLRQLSGQDFGDDGAAWIEWGAQQPNISRILLKEIPHFEILLFQLDGEILRAKIDARKTLKRATGQDFGDDVEAWRTWLQEHGKLKGKT